MCQWPPLPPYLLRYLFPAFFQRIPGPAAPTVSLSNGWIPLFSSNCLTLCPAAAAGFFSAWDGFLARKKLFFHCHVRSLIPSLQHFCFINLSCEGIIGFNPPCPSSQCQQCVCVLTQDLHHKFLHQWFLRLQTDLSQRCLYSGRIWAIWWALCAVVLCQGTNQIKTIDCSGRFERMKNESSHPERNSGFCLIVCSGLYLKMYLFQQWISV